MTKECEGYCPPSIYAKPMLEEIIHGVDTKPWSTILKVMIIRIKIKTRILDVLQNNIARNSADHKGSPFYRNGVEALTSFVSVPLVCGLHSGLSQRTQKEAILWKEDRDKYNIEIEVLEN